LTISFEDGERLRLAGFIPTEIEAFATAVTPEGLPQPAIDLEGDVWQRVMKSRRDWVNDKIERGWEDEEITNAIMDYYRRNEERSPWDFLRVEYRPPEKIDYKEAIRRRARETTAELRRL